MTVGSAVSLDDSTAPSAYKVLITVLVEKLRRHGRLTRADFGSLPFDDLRVL
jgi:hypothetical protein